MLDREEALPPPNPVSFAQALRFWAKLGCISFGGPAGQIALMHSELVERRRWLSEAQFLHALDFCMVLPGPEAQQLATYAGWRLHGTRGGIAAGVLFVLPAALLLFALSWAYATWGSVRSVEGVFAGCKAVVVAIVAEAVWRLGSRAVRQPAHGVIALGAFAGIYALGIPFPWIVLLAALAGLCTTAPPKSSGAAALAATSELAAPRPQAGHAVRVLGGALVLWAAPLAICLVLWGSDSLPVRQYLFFSGAALITFGGAYAVLAYVSQAAVVSFAWITPAQAIDGLSLAETTPGPLIMVLQFVGFMTGWNHPGTMSPLAAATLGAFLTTWATFLPSFVFILLGGPHVESLRGKPLVARALAGVTAAVLGVILNLALTFGTAVLLPHGLAHGVDWFALALAVAAFAVLLSRRAGVLAVVLGGGGAGLLRALIA